MKILFLSTRKHLISFLTQNGDEVVQYTDPINDEILEGIDFIINYGYNRRIDKEVIERFKNRAINLHIGYLPYNRGADPNLWSWLEDTPKGVTIHYLDGNIDTGPIIMRKLVNFSNIIDETLRTTYKKLQDELELLFCANWLDIRNGEVESIPQLTFHRIVDREKYADLLTKGWDTPIKDIFCKAK